MAENTTLDAEKAAATRSAAGLLRGMEAAAESLESFAASTWSSMEERAGACFIAVLARAVVEEARAKAPEAILAVVAEVEAHGIAK